MIAIARFERGDIDDVYAIQRAAFRPLYEKYHDDGLNPYLESRETILQKYTREGIVGYIFKMGGLTVGAVRVGISDAGKSGRIAGLCVMPNYQGRGIAQEALLEIEMMHPGIEKWCLDTIQEETGNCYLYEKIGYKKTGKTEVINEKMTLVFYEKIKRII